MYKREIPYSLADFSSTLQNPEMNSSKMRKGRVSAPWDTPRGHPEGTPRGTHFRAFDASFGSSLAAASNGALGTPESTFKFVPQQRRRREI